MPYQENQKQSPYSQQEIMHCLQVIQTVCESSSPDCSDCPFCNQEECQFIQCPAVWNLNTNGNWKAFC